MPSYRPPEGGHRRVIGVIFIVSGLLYTAVLVLILLTVMNRPAGQRVSARLAREILVTQNGAFAILLAAYLLHEALEGRRTSREDVADIFAGFFPYLLLFWLVSHGLAAKLLHPFWGFLPGAFKIGYGAVLCQGFSFFKE